MGVHEPSPTATAWTTTGKWATHTVVVGVVIVETTETGGHTVMGVCTWDDDSLWTSTGGT